jgi:hypothetical protein
LIPGTGLVERAQSEFYANNYEVSEQLLVRAATRHTTISDEEDPNVRYWLAIVRRILARPEYRNSSRFQELLQKIESVL